MLTPKKNSVPQLVAALLAVALLMLLLVPAAGAAVPAHGRAWELVTPGEGNGVMTFGARAWSEDGDRVVYATFGARPGSPSGELQSQGVARRGPQGWSLEPLGQPHLNPDLALEAPAAAAGDPAMSSWLWASTLPLLPAAPAPPDIGLYRQAADGTLTLLANVGSRDDGFRALGLTSDLTRLAFQTNTALLPADTGRVEGSAAYELVGSTLRLVGVDDAGDPISPCGSVIGNGFLEYDPGPNPISRDGSRIFFAAPADQYSSCGDPVRVYVRDNGSDTTDISASDCTRPDCNEPQSVFWVGATPDGSRAFLFTSQQLTDDDVDDGPDLYRRDLDDGSLTRLSAGASGGVAGVDQATPHFSDDGERAYFLSTGALREDANVYVYDHGALRFIGAADPDALRSVSMTGDGESFAFTTTAAMLPSDADASVDVYRYDAASGELEHVSLGQGGRGNQELEAAFAPVRMAPMLGQKLRYQSEDGRRLLFTTSEALVPEDQDGTLDVYERADGVLGLVTSGKDASSALFSGVSADGRNAFFVTQESLVAADDDRGDTDLYTARLGGGFPDPIGPPAPCVEDACQPAASGRVNRERPGSMTDAGAAPPTSAAFGPRTPTAKARRQLAQGKRVRLAVAAPAAGRLELVVRARVKGRSTVVARARANARRAGVVRMPVKLSRAARRALQAKGSLRLTLAVRHSTRGAARPVHINLKKAAKRSRGGRTS